MILNNISNKLRQLNQRPIYNHILTPNRKTCYCRIPKNACTAMRYGIAAKLGYIDTTKPFEAIKWVNSNTKVLVKKDKNFEKFNAENFFIILRNPIKRLISCYLDRVVNKKDSIFKLIKEKTGELINEDLTFEYFINNILSKIYLNNPHFVPQYLFMRKNIHYNHMYDISKLNSLIKTGKLFELTGIDYYQTDILSDHTTSLKIKVAIKESYKLPLREIRKMNDNYLTLDENEFLNESIYNTLQKIYSKDLELLKFLNKDE